MRVLYSFPGDVNHNKLLWQIRVYDMQAQMLHESGERRSDCELSKRVTVLALMIRSVMASL